MSETKHIWRLLEIGEPTLVGDEFFHTEARCWKRANYGLRIDSNFYIHRRRVPASPVIRDARTDPPKESDAVGGSVLAVCVMTGGWRVVHWNACGFGGDNPYVWWATLPPIPEPEKTEAELAFDEAQKAFASQKYKDAVDWASFSKGYEMGKAAK